MRITIYNTILDEGRVPLLIKKRAHNYNCINGRFDNPQKIVDMLKDIFQLHKATEEYLYLIALNTKLQFIGVFEISHGTVNASYADPRVIFMKSLLCGAVSIIMAHNHPSQDVTPSDEDLQLAHRISAAGRLIGIPLIDNIIIGNDYISFKEHMLLN